MHITIPNLVSFAYAGGHTLEICQKQMMDCVVGFAVHVDTMADVNLSLGLTGQSIP